MKAVLLNNFPTFVQLKDANLKELYRQNIKDELSKGEFGTQDKADCLNMKNPRESYLRHHPVVQPHNSG